MEQYREFWEESLDRLDQYLNSVMADEKIKQLKRKKKNYTKGNKNVSKK